jgi:hypothetical protein
VAENRAVRIGVVEPDPPGTVAKRPFTPAPVNVISQLARIQRCSWNQVVQDADARHRDRCGT